MEKLEFTDDMIKERLLKNKDIKYKKFMEKLLPGTDKILGVRFPELRKLAKEIAGANWRWVLEKGEETYFEQIMVKGMIIGNLKIELEEWKQYITYFVPKIQNWSVCDSFCSSLKQTRNYKPAMWEFIKEYTKREEEFSVRFGVVMILNYFVEEEYLTDIFSILQGIQNRQYYVKMAVSWAVSICYIKFPDKTWEFILENKLDRWTLQKALQKIIESRVADKKEKDKIRQIKKEFLN